MSPNAILRAWEKRWGSLPEGKREDFLVRDEIQELEKFPTKHLQEAIGKHKKLVKILGEVQATSHWEPPAKRYRPWTGMINDPNR
jgi:hypothetical protein